MIDQEHQQVYGKITDYVLDILPQDERRVVARHIIGCGSCRQAVLQERQIGLAVKRAISRATDVEKTMLAKRQPTLSRSGRIQVIFGHWHRQILLASCLLILAIASIGLQLRLQERPWTATSPAILSTTIKSTETPTATLLATTEGVMPEKVIPPTPAKGQLNFAPEAALAPVASSPAQLIGTSLQ